MTTKAKENEYQFSEDEARNRSLLARNFLEKREDQNGAFDAADNRLLKRFFNLDTNAYLTSDGVPTKYKELMGLAVSTAMRCESCIYYHLIQSFRLGTNRLEIEESLNIALIIGGSIVIPSLRNAYGMLNELLPPNAEQ
jgi:AhpD family alkylhydroperoxidase